MKRAFTSLVFGGLLIVGCGGVSFAQDFALGAAAYQRGDYATAFREISIVAEQGNADAQFILAAMYFKGQGVTQDYREAAKWTRLSAEQGQRGAQFSLGQLYLTGQSVTQDYREAAKWFRLSAEQGQAEAQNNLGTMFAEGQGVTQDYIYAHMWFNIAASTGGKEALANRDRIAGKMTAEQIARAQELAKQCVTKDYKGC
jgi:TPR repeat protein